MPENVSNVPVGFVWAALLFGLLAVVGGGVKVGIIHIPGMLGERERRSAGRASVALFAAAFCTLLIGPATTLLDHRRVVPRSAPGPNVMVPEPLPLANRPTPSSVESRTSVTGVVIGPGGQEAVRGAAGQLGELADSAEVICRRAAVELDTRLAAFEAVLWNRPTRDGARSVAEGFQFRLRDAGWAPYTWDAQTLVGSWESSDRSVRGLMWSSPDGRSWIWVACQMR